VKYLKLLLFVIIILMGVSSNALEGYDTPVGSLLFEIKGADTQDVIAVKVNDKFFNASKLGTIQFITTVHISNP